MPGSDAAGPDDDQPAAEVAESSTESASRWWVAAVTFVAGVVTGVLAVGLLSWGKPDFVTAVENVPSTGTTARVPTGIETTGVTGTVEVNVACLRVINEAQDIYTILTGADQAVQDVDLQQLDDIVRRLQPIEPRLERDLVDCRVAGNVDTGASGAAPSPVIPTAGSAGPATPTATSTR
ncbi:hypothetical protein [Microlunatus ginsengisoli]|uniref:Uncharacterized protein n=1 Tax=Microlunatus ginsengisoli TaxID=363863 RepID=A0ABP6ZIG6_9ACTN